MRSCGRATSRHSGPPKLLLVRHFREEGRDDGHGRTIGRKPAPILAMRQTPSPPASLGPPCLRAEVYPEPRAARAAGPCGLSQSHYRSRTRRSLDGLHQAFSVGEIVGTSLGQTPDFQNDEGRRSALAFGILSRSSIRQTPTRFVVPPSQAAAAPSASTGPCPDRASGPPVRSVTRCPAPGTHGR